MGLIQGTNLVQDQVFTQTDFDRFAALSGDDNPIHVDPQFSERTRFGKTVAHGMLLYSTMCAYLSGLAPGRLMLQLEQELMFPAPTFTNQEVKCCLEVTGSPAAGIDEISMNITRPDDETSLQGKTRIRILPQGRDQSLDQHALENYFRYPAGIVPLYQSEEASGAAIHKGLQIGAAASIQRIYTKADIEEYASLTGDQNGLYTDAEIARKYGFQDSLLPGGLLGGLFSYLMGTKLPGRGTNWLKQKFRFLSPAYPGESIHAQVTIVRIRPEKDLVNLRTSCMHSDGSLVCDGEALVYVHDLENPD